MTKVHLLEYFIIRNLIVYLSVCITIITPPLLFKVAYCKEFLFLFCNVHLKGNLSSFVTDFIKI